MPAAEQGSAAVSLTGKSWHICVISTRSVLYCPVWVLILNAVALDAGGASPVFSCH
jgi:hypothetical protein